MLTIGSTVSVLYCPDIMHPSFSSFPLSPGLQITGQEWHMSWSGLVLKSDVPESENVLQFGNTFKILNAHALVKGQGQLFFSFLIFKNVLG